MDNGSDFLPVMFYLHGYLDVMMDPFAKQFVEQFAGRYRIVVPELDIDLERSVAILNELIEKEQPQMIVARGTDAYNAMRADWGEDVDVIAVNPFPGEGLDEIPLWKFGNIFALCSARNGLYGDSYITTLREKYPDIHLTESKAFGNNLNKVGFKQLCRLVRSVAEYRKLCGEHMSLAEFENMVRNRPTPDMPSYYRLQVWSYDNGTTFSEEIVNDTPTYRLQVNCRQAEFPSKEEALEAMSQIAVSGEENVCMFTLERLPFGVFDEEPFWLEAWTFDPAGNLIQEAPCSASHYHKAGIFGKFLGHLPEKIKCHKGDIVQIVHKYFGDYKTYMTLGIVIDTPKEVSECFETYINARETWIKDGNKPKDWTEIKAYAGSDDDEMFIQFGPYDEDWRNFTFNSTMMVVQAPENLPDGIKTKLQAWREDWLEHKDD